MDENYKGPYEGYCSTEGTEKYRDREVKYSEFFKQILIDEQLNISKYALSTFGYKIDKNGDFILYNSLKEGLRGGGMNLIDTSFDERH